MSDSFVVALGNFDGVHKGHQKILLETKKLAQSLGIENNWGVVFFNPHPREFFSSQRSFFLNSREDKISLLKHYGVEHLFEIDFKEICNLSPQEFVDKLTSDYAVLGVITGENFFFGKDKTGDNEILSKICKEKNIKYIAIKEQLDQNQEVYSSSNIRKLLSQGKVKQASELLGYNFKITSKVVHGNKLGRELGFPTANFFIGNYIAPLYGVYIVKAKLGSNTYEAIANFGLRPTASKEKTEILEVHFLNFSDDLYDKVVQIEFVEFVRSEQKFQSINELKQQIEKDKNSALIYFKNNY